jgi:hypothetical protein
LPSESCKTFKNLGYETFKKEASRGREVDQMKYSVKLLAHGLSRLYVPGS